MTWLEIIKAGKTQANIRLDRDQALTLAEAILGPADGTGLLTSYMANHYSAGWRAGYHAATLEQAEADAYQQFGELAPVVAGVTLPESSVGGNALQQLTLGVGAEVTVANQPIMTTLDAAQAQSNVPDQPLLIPQLYTALKTRADSIRAQRNIPATDPVDAPLAIQGDKTMRYDLLSRLMQTARLAGFKNISLQVKRVGGAAST